MDDAGYTDAIGQLDFPVVCVNAHKTFFTHLPNLFPSIRDGDRSCVVDIQATVAR